jgi:RNA polymerase sigma-70 factor (ECF subfamily)
VRKKRKTISVESEQIKKDEGKSESDHLQYKELNESIQKVLSILPERSRKIFEMSRFEGLKYQEIAEKLSISVKTVEANMTKTLKTFRKHLKQYRNLILLF